MTNRPVYLESLYDGIDQFRAYLGAGMEGQVREYGELLERSRDEPWLRIAIDDASPLAATLHAYDLVRLGRKVREPRLYQLGTLARAWCAVVDADARVQASGMMRRRLLRDPAPPYQEILLAWHFLRPGLEMDPVCLRISSSPDLLVKGPGGTVSVELKVLGRTTGMRIPSDAIRAVAMRLFEAIREPRTSFIATLVSDDRLDRNDSGMLAEHLVDIIRSGRDVEAQRVGEYTLSVRQLGKRIPKSKALELYGRELNLDPRRPPHTAFWDLRALSDRAVPMGSAVTFATLVGRSAQADSVARALAERIRNASRQLVPRDQPGVVNVHLRQHVDWSSFGGLPEIDALIGSTCEEIGENAPSAVMLSSEPVMRAVDDIVSTGAQSYTVEFDSPRGPLPGWVAETIRTAASA